jgi:hypothetical protein
MKPVARIINRVSMENEHESLIEWGRIHSIIQRIPGWTKPEQALFFLAVLEELFRSERTPRMLICGVYHGLDLALIADVAAAYFGRSVELHGVDLFSAEPCADWPEEKRGMTWEQAFQCPPPSLDAARANCPGAQIYQNKASYHVECRPRRVL